MGPLDLLPYDPPGRFGREPAWNAYVELHNVLAAAEAPFDVGPDDRRRIARERGVDLETAFLGERVALYGVLLHDALASGALGDDTADALGHLARTLALAPADLRHTHRRAFGRAVDDAVADDRLSVAERLHLHGLQQRLGLDPRLAAYATDHLAGERLLQAVARALCDGELSDDEAAGIARLEADLGVRVPDAVRARLDAAARRWQAQHGPLPRVAPPVALRSGEQAHLVAPARWRTVTLSAFEATLTTPRSRASVAQGGSESVRLSPTTLHDLTDGRVLATSQRVRLLPGFAPAVDVSLASVQEVLPFANAVGLRLSGARVVLVDAGEATWALGVLVRRLLARGA